MPPTTPPLEFNHLPGQEIETKHKEAIRQLYGFAKVPVERLMTRYGLARSTVEKILRYDAPERARITRTGRPTLLTDTQVDEIIEYASESWEHRILDFTLLHNELSFNALFKHSSAGLNNEAISVAWLAKSPTSQQLRLWHDYSGRLHIYSGRRSG